MRIILEGTSEQIPIENQAFSENPQKVKYISEKDLRKAVEFLSYLFHKNAGHELFGHMKDVELSSFVNRILSK